MKKAVILLLAMVYLAITSGVMVNIHYCMGEVAAVNYGHEKDHACEKCGMEQKDGCCHTEHKLIKSNDEHQLIKYTTGIDNFQADLPVSYIVIPSGYFNSPFDNGLFYYPPPDRRLNSLHLYNSVFRI
ncbi:MAG: hypothetical protein J7497_08220 [Chitinophagaceae bacterium]|nr:hypothetical protein [Chitinophagaceae bacterium]